MKWLWLVLVVACGSKQPAQTTPDPEPTPGVVQDTRTPLEKRRDAACDVVAKRVTACAVDDAKADLAAGKVTKQQFDKDTASAVVAKNAEKYADACKAHRDYSSRQIRVLEKCPQYETECGPLLKCLENLQPQKK
ncbi:MAG: hypothetical protein ACM31C_23365 [Acidobacteriota bacterium]